MAITPEQAEIIWWGNRNRQMLRENYRRQFVAYRARILAAGTDYHQVKAEAKKMGEPFLMDWMPALRSDVQFY